MTEPVVGNKKRPADFATGLSRGCPKRPKALAGGRLI
jgi:hypothetical protein